MGISDLLPFLRKQVPHAFEAQTPGHFTTIALDVPLIAHKFSCVDGSTAQLELRFETLIRKLIQDGFQTLYMIFDGCKTPLKDRERSARSTQRQKTLDKIHSDSNVVMIVENSDFSKQPTTQDQDRLKTFFVRDHVQVQIAQQEAEARVAYLVRQKICDVGLSEDSDSLAFLSPKTLMHYNKPDAIIVNLETILKEWNMTPEKFQIFCILSGCDFLQRLPLVGPAKLLSLHKKSIDVDDFVAQAYSSCKDTSFIEEHRELYPQVVQFFQTCANEIAEKDTSSNL